MAPTVRSIEERVRRVDDGSSSGDDDLDIVRSSRKEVTGKEVNGKELNLVPFLEDPSQTSSAESGDSAQQLQRKRKRKLAGERIAWSDDEEPDQAYNAFKNRKSEQRKKAAARTRKAKAAVTESTGVGRKRRTVIKIKEDPARSKKHDTYGEDSEDDDAPEAALPQFLKDRRSKFEDHRHRLGEAGLSIPPSYEEVYFSDDDRMQDLREKPILSHLKPVAPYEDVELRYSAGIIPAPIAQWLRDYQVKGAEFLHELFVFQKGGILGDDMGLGKTIQVIAFLTAAFGKTGDERDAKRMRKMRRTTDGRWYPKVLIVCPGGLMQNWKSELDRWGWWQVDTFHGSPGVRNAVLSAAKQGRLEIMITTYTTYRNHRSSINMVDWDCVIADECHQVKERSSETTKALNEVNALCRIGLTGTAIQNKYDELWTLLNWTNPGKFGPLSSWKKSIADPLKIGQSHNATMAELSKARKTAKKLVTNLLPNFFLRRMKSLIADQLPKKTDKVVFCPLTDIQAQAYANLTESDMFEYIRRSSEACDCGREKHGKEKKRGWCCYMDIPGHGRWQNYVFPCLMTLQKLANHAALLIPQSQEPREKQDKDLEWLELALPTLWRDLYRERDSIMHYARQEFCGKWKILKKLLKFWHSNGDKVLVFSHSVRLLKMLQMLFNSTTSYNVSYLDGSMKYEDRSIAVDDFNTNPTQFVFLISTKAGGVGLNITSANKVVVFDPNWNPSYDLQAQDRAYRIGQTRDVEVFRLISAGTVEEIVYARQIYKQQQANIAYNASLERRYFTGVQDRKESKGELFGLANLFFFQGDNVVLRDIVNKTNIAESKAGIAVIGLDINTADDDDDNHADHDPLADPMSEKEHAAMSQLAAMITGDADDSVLKRKRDAAKAKKTDAVAAILAGAGVAYTHENSEVIGSSKIETGLSRRAEAAGNDIDVSREHVFGKKGENPSFDRGYGDEDVDDGGDVVMDGGDAVELKYRPPEQVRRRQFCAVAALMGYQDATDFALVVENWTQEQRRSCLERFYRERKRVLAGGVGA